MYNVISCFSSYKEALMLSIDVYVKYPIISSIFNCDFTA